MDVNLFGLKQFEATLNKTRENVKGKSENSFVKQKIGVAKDTIKEAYAGEMGIVVKVVKKDSRHYSIRAVDLKPKPTIAFDEFGTGFYAEGSYKGKLPTQKITFISAGKKRVTMGWKYYYPNRQTKVTHGGFKGWKFGKNFSIGQDASNRMYNACKNVRGKLKGKNR